MRALKPARARRGCGRRVVRSIAYALLPAWGLALCASAAVLDPDALIVSIARTPPTTVSFTEARYSALLQQPIVVSGELGYPAVASLDRIVTIPYRERTSIRGDAVTVEREGEQSRTFALRRAPELRGLLVGVTALLGGDAAAVRRDFGVSASGSAESWRLDLTPTDGAVLRRLTALVATGMNSELGCLAVRNAQGGTTVMLIGGAAADGIAPDTSLASLLERCRAE